MNVVDPWRRFSATPAPLYQILPVSWHRQWVAATHSIDAVMRPGAP